MNMPLSDSSLMTVTSTDYGNQSGYEDFIVRIKITEGTEFFFAQMS
jgi:hypothetical protein